MNIDHVATVRQARLAPEPDPVRAAVLAELGGADGITIHLREDRRHIQDRDVELLRATVTTKLNLEMGLAADIIEIALGLKPGPRFGQILEAVEERWIAGDLDTREEALAWIKTHWLTDDTE